MIRSFFAFLKGVFSESTEPFSPSWARIAATMFSIAAVVWVTHIVRQSHVLPPLWELAMFCSSPYIVNKTSATIEAFKK